MSVCEVIATDGDARCCRVQTSHGAIMTPVFMPVGTHANVKGCLPQEVRDAGAQIILANSYHLALRPGVDRVEAMGGLHRMMGWDGPILTDSGGYQLVSLSAVARVTQEGAEFVSPYDGSRLWVTPQDAVDQQYRMGADIIMCLDHPVEWAPGAGDGGEAFERTIRWARLCRDAHPGDGRLLFGIAQGGFDTDARVRSAEAVASLGFDGMAIGGLALGEPVDIMEEMARASVTHLPADAPRYFMGLGTEKELLAMVALGIDMFDCVVPTRLARHGVAMTPTGHLRLRQHQYLDDDRIIEEGCTCPACSLGLTRSYLRHLHMAKEVLADRLVSLHNITHLCHLMEGARAAIAAGRFEEYRCGVVDTLDEETNTSGGPLSRHMPPSWWKVEDAVPSSLTESNFDPAGSM